MVGEDYSQHYGTYRTKDGTTIVISKSIMDGRVKKTEPKNIYKRDDGYYEIRKTINYKNYGFGKYLTLESAMAARRYSNNKGWKNCLNERLKFNEKIKEDKPYFQSRELF